MKQEVGCESESGFNRCMSWFLPYKDVVEIEFKTTSSPSPGCGSQCGMKLSNYNLVR